MYKTKRIDKKKKTKYTCITSNTKEGGLMSTISLRLSDEDSKLIHEYVAANKLNLSQFIRETVLDKIEDDLQLDEERILNALKKAETEKKYDHTEVWKMLNV